MTARARARPGARLAALSAVIGSLGAVGWTESPPAAEQAETAPSFQETASVYGRPLPSATSSASLLERDAFEALDPLGLEDLLQHAPGVSLSRGGRSGLTTAALRGGDPNFTLVMLDGIPLNDSTDQQGGAVSLSSLPLGLVDSVEVVRGPLSSFLGPSGLSGAINIVTPGGRRGGGPRTTLELETGASELARGSARVSAGEGSARGFAGLSFEREEGRLGDDRLELYHALGNAAFALDSETELLVQARAGYADGASYPEASGGPRFGSGELRTSTDRTQAGGLTLRRAGPRLFQRLSASLSRQSRDRSSPAIGFAVPAAVETTRYVDARLGWWARLPLSEGGSPQSLSLGIDLQRESGRNRSLLLLGPEAGEVPGDYDISRTNAGLELALSLERGDAVVDLSSRLDLSEGSPPEWSPRIGASLRPGGGPLRVRASLGRAFKPPSFFALGSPAALGGNPELRPETALGADVGVEHQSEARGLKLGLTLFVNRFRDLVDFDFDSFRHVNRSEVRSHGTELELAFRPAPKFDLHLAATWQRTEDAATAEPLRGRPSWSGGARFGWRPRSELALGLDARFATENPDRELPVPERTASAGYAVLGAGVSWRPAARWSLHLRADNLLDRDYETLVGFPGPGASLRVGLRYSFAAAAGADAEL